MLRVSATSSISSEVGLGFFAKAFSSASSFVVSKVVLFFRRLPILSAEDRELQYMPPLLLIELSASYSHLARGTFNFNMALNDKVRASNLEMVV